MKKIVGVIPARMASTRFPGKPMKKIHGIPMIAHVYYRTKMCKMLQNVYVATCDKEIFDYIESIGGKAIMTSDKHERCSDRVAEALNNIPYDIALMIQGDEPMLHPEMIDSALSPILNDNDVGVVNLMAVMKTEMEENDPNEVKVVIDRNSDAIYFSRESIPSSKKASFNFDVYKQVCVIPFTKEYLDLFDKLEPTPLEKIESVDMMRFIEHGYKVKMVMTEHETYSVDTIKDLQVAEEKMSYDPILEIYKNHQKSV